MYLWVYNTHLCNRYAQRHIKELIRSLQFGETKIQLLLLKTPSILLLLVHKIGFSFKVFDIELTYFYKI